MADIIQMRGDTEENWIACNPVLSARELVFSIINVPPFVKMKIGNGIDPWATLPYFAGLNGIDGKSGKDGMNGTDGKSATIEVRNVTTGNAGTQVQITNSGTSSAAVLDFVIPKGADGTGTGDMLKSTYDTNNNGKVDQIDDNAATDTVIGNRTADPTTTTAYTLTGSVTQFFSWITKRFFEATGYAWGVVIPASLKKLWELTEPKTIFIPTGFLGMIHRETSDKTYNYLYVDCCDVNFAPQNPTSFILNIYKNGNTTPIYTSPAITTAAFTATVSLVITAGDLMRYVITNTTGLTGGVAVSPRRVNR